MRNRRTTVERTVVCSAVVQLSPDSGHRLRLLVRRRRHRSMPSRCQKCQGWRDIRRLSGTAPGANHAGYPPALDRQVGSVSNAETVCGAPLVFRSSRRSTVACENGETECLWPRTCPPIAASPERQSRRTELRQLSSISPPVGFVACGMKRSHAFRMTHAAECSPGTPWIASSVRCGRFLGAMVPRSN